MPKNVRKIFLTEQTSPAPSGRSWLSKLKSLCVLLARRLSTRWHCLWSLWLHGKTPLYTQCTWTQQAPCRISVCACDAMATLPSITFSADQQTLFDPRGTKWQDPGVEIRCGDFRWPFSLRNLDHPCECGPLSYPSIAMQIHTCNKGPELRVLGCSLEHSSLAGGIQPSLPIFWGVPSLLLLDTELA